MVCIYFLQKKERKFIFRFDFEMWPIYVCSLDKRKLPWRFDSSTNTFKFNLNSQLNFLELRTNSKFDMSPPDFQKNAQLKIDKTM